MFVGISNVVVPGGEALIPGWSGMLDTLCRTAALHSVGVRVVCVGWGWWVLHTRACSASVGTAESCGTAMSVAVTVPLPCATPTTTTPHTEIGPLPARDRSSSARPTRRRGTHDKLEGEGRVPHLRTIGEQQVRSSATDLDAEPDRSRAGLRPISVRNRTDLEPGYDRSRCGSGPISVELAAVGQAPCEGVTSSKPWLPVPWVRTGVHPRRGAAAEVAPSRER